MTVTETLPGLSDEPIDLAASHTERSMLDLLNRRYTSIRPGTTSDRWVRAEHVRRKLGFETTRICDYMAADKWPGIPYGSRIAFHGHEVKVSRSDWLRELKEPEKAEEFKRHMHYWWLVVPDVRIVKADELPAGWALMVIRGERLVAKKRAPRLEPEPLPLDLSISFAAAAQKVGLKLGATA